MPFQKTWGLTLGPMWLAGMASHPPIPVMELADHLERLKANDNLKFSQEYEVSVGKFLMLIELCECESAA